MKTWREICIAIARLALRLTNYTLRKKTCNRRATIRETGEREKTSTEAKGVANKESQGTRTRPPQV